jgi:S1-C subfamily serine protease
MKNPVLILAAFTMNVGFLCHEGEADAISEELYEKFDPLVVTVQILDENHKGLGHGTGFIFQEVYIGGQYCSVVVTCFHVVKAEQEDRTKWTKYSYEIINNKGKKVAESQETYSDPRHDLALIIVRGRQLQAEMTARPLGFLVFLPQAVKAGLDIVMIGSPKGYRDTLSEGEISNVPEGGNEWVQDQVYQINAPSSQGSSGSPVFVKERGEYGESYLVGVQESIDERGQNLTFIVPGAYVELLEYAFDERFTGIKTRAFLLSNLGVSSQLVFEWRKQYEYHTGGE